MAYKFQNGSFIITHDGSGTESLAITGDLDVDAAGSQVTTADDVIASGNMTADVSVSAAKAHVHQDGAIDNGDLLFQIQNASSDNLALAGKVNARSEIRLQHNAGFRSVLHGSDGSGKGGFKIYNGSGQLRHRLDGGDLGVHRNVTLSGDLSIDGPNVGTPSTLLVGGELQVGGNLTADATNVTLLDKSFHINHDATNKAGSDATKFNIGDDSNNNVAVLKFDQANDQIVVQGGAETGSDAAEISVFANLVGDGTSLSGITQTLSFPTVTKGTAGSFNLAASDAGKIQVCTAAGAYILNLPASAGLAVGQLFKIKGSSNTSETNSITINTNGSDVFGVDGASSGAGRGQIKLESPHAMVELVFLGTIEINSQSKARFAIL